MIIVTHVWQSSVCVGVAALLTLALRRSAADLRYRIWLLASAKFLVPFSLVTIAGSAAAGWLTPLVSASAGLSRTWLDKPLAIWNLEVGAGASTSSILDPAWAIGLATVWAAGSIALIVWRWKVWREIATIADLAQRLEQGREIDALRRVLQSSPQLDALDLRQSDAHLEPALLGVRRPTLLWPAQLSPRLTDDELDVIVAHEACHAKRRDNLMAIVQMAVEIVFWFCPLVWWLGARLTIERELACDEDVVRCGADKQSYAEAILKVCRYCLQRPIVLGSGVGGGNLTKRIERIMQQTPASSPTRLATTLIAVVAILTVAAPFASGVAGAGPTNPTLQQEEKVYNPGNGITLPKLMREVKPQYTEEGKAAKIQGSVWLDVVVLDTGEVGEVTVAKSLDTEHGLDDAAVTAMKQWLFAPGTKDGKPVAVRVQVEMTFTLK